VHAVLAQVPTRHGPNGIVVELTHTALILALWNSLSRSNSNHSIPSYKRCSSRLLKRTELWRKRPSSRCNNSNSHTTATTLLPRCPSQSAPAPAYLSINLSISRFLCQTSTAHTDTDHALLGRLLVRLSIRIVHHSWFRVAAPTLRLPRSYAIKHIIHPPYSSCSRLAPVLRVSPQNCVCISYRDTHSSYRCCVCVCAQECSGSTRSSSRIAILVMMVAMAIGDVGVV